MSWIRKDALWCILAGVVAMALAIWGVWQGVRYTNIIEFCLSCHSMRTVGEEYETSMHFRSTSDVQAERKDCHIPPGTAPTSTRKAEALSDLYHTSISPFIDILEKFAAKHPELAQWEWVRISTNNSTACKSYHSYKAVDHGKQSVNAVTQMVVTAVEDGNCIDCHKGIAHHKPDMSGGFRDRYKQLQRQGDTLADAATQFSLSGKLLATTAGGPAGKALLFPTTEVRVPKKEGSSVQLEVTGRREDKGRGRVITQYMGKRVFSVVLDEPLMASVKVLYTQIDLDSYQGWQQVGVTVRTTDQDFINTLVPIWEHSN